MVVSESLKKQKYDLYNLAKISNGSNVNSTGKSFADSVKSATNTVSYTDDEIKSQSVKNSAFNLLSKTGNYDLARNISATATASTEVKLACIDASAETGSNLKRVGGKDNGCNTKFVYMGTSKAIDGHIAALGNSIKTAKAVLTTANYQVQHPTSGEYRANPEWYTLESELYKNILDKLDKLESGELSYEGQDLFSRLNTNGQLGDIDQRGIIDAREGSIAANQNDILSETSFISDNGDNISMRCAYSSDSTPQNPLVDVEITDSDGTMVYKVDISKISEDSLSQVEGFALLSYCDDPYYVQKTNVDGPDDLGTLNRRMYRSIMGGSSTDYDALSMYQMRTYDEVYFTDEELEELEDPETLIFNELNKMTERKEVATHEEKIKLQRELAMKAYEHQLEMQELYDV